MDRITLALFIFILVREVIYQISTHRLINKLMSRDFGEYMISSQHRVSGENKTVSQDQDFSRSLDGIERVSM